MDLFLLEWQNSGVPVYYILAIQQVYIYDYMALHLLFWSANQKAATAYFSSKQLLPFGFAEQYYTCLVVAGRGGASAIVGGGAGRLSCLLVSTGPAEWRLLGS